MDLMPATGKASAKVLNDFPTAAADGRVFMGNDQDLHWIRQSVIDQDLSAFTTSRTVYMGLSCDSW